MPPIVTLIALYNMLHEVTHDINPGTISARWTQQNINPHTTCKTHNDPQPKIKTSLLMPSDIQVHRQVPVDNANILVETKLALHKLLKKLTP